jgi:hypothetical protein
VEEGHHVNFVKHWTDERMARLIEATSGARIVVKTHAAPAALSPTAVLGALDSDTVKIHVVYRDPRDTIVSMIDRSRRTRRAVFLEPGGVETAIAGLGSQLEALRQWGGFPSLKLQYERFAFERVTGPQLIADDLGVTADPGEVWEIVSRRFTYKNVARPERYRTDLWPDEVARIERAFPLYLELVRGNPPAAWFQAPG